MLIPKGKSGISALHRSVIKENKPRLPQKVSPEGYTEGILLPEEITHDWTHLSYFATQEQVDKYDGIFIVTGKNWNLESEITIDPLTISDPMKCDSMEQ